MCFWVENDLKTLPDFFQSMSFFSFLGQVVKMCDSCFGTLRAKRNLMPSPRPTTEELKPVSLLFPPPTMPPLKPSKSGNEKWKTSVDMCQWFSCKTRLTCCMNHKLTGTQFIFSLGLSCYWSRQLTGEEIFYRESIN